MGREVLAFPGCPGARDAQGVRAPGWEFCSPLLSSNLRLVEIRDQQNKSSCSSSLSLAFSQAGFCWEGPPSTVLEQGQDVQWDLSVCHGMNSSLLSAPKGEGFGVKG